MNKDAVYLYWNNNDKKSYKVAKLYKENNKYYFMYLKECLKEAFENGFDTLIAFPDIDKLYENDKLFAAFACRLPDKRRPDIKEILDTYGLEEYDEYELLKKNGAKLPIDNYEFKNS